jgi:hypothetical protein
MPGVIIVSVRRGPPFLKVRHQGRISHSRNLDHLFRPETLPTAIAIAFLSPAITTSRLPREPRVEKIALKHRVMLRCDESRGYPNKAHRDSPFENVREKEDGSQRELPRMSAQWRRLCYKRRQLHRSLARSVGQLFLGHHRSRRAILHLFTSPALEHLIRRVWVPPVADRFACWSCHAMNPSFGKAHYTAASA